MWGQDFSYAFKFILLALHNKSFNRGDQRSSKRKIFRQNMRQRRNRKGTWPLLVCTGEAFRMFRISGRMWEEACMITYQLLNHLWGIFSFFYVDIFTSASDFKSSSCACECLSHKLHLCHPLCFHNMKTSFPPSPQLTHGKVKNPGRLLQSFTPLSPSLPQGWRNKGARILDLEVRFADHVHVLKQHPLTTSWVNQKGWKTF